MIYGDIDGPIHSAMRRSQFDQAGGQWSRTNPELLRHLELPDTEGKSVVRG